MSFYEDRVLPHLINLACSTEPSRKQRQKLVPQADGDVLEIGFGSGLNLPHYDASRVRKIWALEPSAGMRHKARSGVDASPLDIEFIELPAEEIPLDNQSVDTVLVTYSLCTIPDTLAALEGVRRVLKPGGRLLYCEHGAAPDGRVRRWQNRLNSPWRAISGGCNMNRDIAGLLAAGGFRMTVDERDYVPGPRILSFNYWGTAKIA